MRMTEYQARAIDEEWNEREAALEEARERIKAFDAEVAAKNAAIAAKKIEHPEFIDIGTYKPDGWKVAADPSGDVVWFYITTRGMSGGIHISPDQARDLARLLISAANEVEA